MENDKEPICHVNNIYYNSIQRPKRLAPNHTCNGTSEKDMRKKVCGIRAKGTTGVG
jgi:hypothetical protein